MKIYNKIFQIEWKRLWKSGVFRSLILVLILFLISAFYTGIRYQSFREETIEYINKTEKERYAEFKGVVEELERKNEAFAGNGHRDPSNPMGVANSTGNRTFYLPPTKLSFINIGESDITPNYYKLGLYKKTTLYHEAEIENASILYNGHFDISFVIVFVLPLLIIALTYNITSFDKEHGTLGILLSGIVGFRKIISIRYAIRVLLLYLATIVLFSLGVLFTGKFDVFLEKSFWILLFITFVYTLFWAALSYFVTSFQRSSGFNASVLVVLWVLLVVLLPGIIKEVSSKIHTMPSRIDMIAKKREVTDSIRNKSNDALNQFLEDHPDLVPNTGVDNSLKNSITRYSVDVAVNDVLKPLEKVFDEQLSKQEEMIESYRFLSPVIMMQKMMDYTSGSSKERYTEFTKQLESFREEYRAFFAKRIFSASKFKSEEYDIIPKKEYEEKNIEGNKFLINLLFLLILSILLIILSQKQLIKLKK